LVEAGAELTLVVPSVWTASGVERELTREAYPVRELAVRRRGDVNRHAYPSRDELVEVFQAWRPDVLDLHEEPFSRAAQQWLRAAPTDLPVVMYTAQNVDKRYPPPFDRYERRSHQRVSALYPCTRQAAAVARGKGFQGVLDVISLGFDPDRFSAGSQSLEAGVVTLALFGRLVPEKGVCDAVSILAHVNAVRPAQLVVVGEGPEVGRAQQLALELGVADRLRIERWRPSDELAEIYQAAHVVLVPSVPTATWTEQFGRVIVEAQATGAVVAGYATGSIPEVAGDAAVLVPGGDAGALADAVRALLADPTDYEMRRASGLELSGGRTWQRVAERQVELYRRVCSGDVERLDLPASPRARRAFAAREFGPAATLTAGRRPFALPLLRSGGFFADGLAAAIDAGAEVKAKLQR
jgi:glycosyltransferase involved in cell wall biosynthesis